MKCSSSKRNVAKKRTQANPDDYGWKAWRWDNEPLKGGRYRVFIGENAKIMPSKGWYDLMNERGAQFDGCSLKVVVISGRSGSAMSMRLLVAESVDGFRVLVTRKMLLRRTDARLSSRLDRKLDRQIYREMYAAANTVVDLLADTRC